MATPGPDLIQKRNKQVFFSGIVNQIFPLSRQIGTRWFDVIVAPDESLSTGF